MKYLSLIFFILILGCSEKDEAPKIECLLTKILVKGTSFESQTTYTYNASSKMDKQVRVRGGMTIFSYTYSYTSNGKVDKVDMGDHYLLYEYATDGKVAIISNYSTTGTLNENYIYTRLGENVEIKYIKSGMPNPYQIEFYEFNGDNLVKHTFKSYTGNEPNVLNDITEISFEDFDLALSAFYVASLTRPGYSEETSKNNPRKQITITKKYDNGLLIQESTTTTIFSYTYNDSNVTITSKATIGGTSELNTEITYDKCN